MSVEIPSDLTSFVGRMIAERRFLSESDVLAEGLRLLQSREALRQEVRLGFAQLDGGSGVADHEVYAKAEERIRKVEQDRDSAN